MIKYLLFENPYPIIITLTIFILFILKFDIFPDYKKRIIYILFILIPISFFTAKFVDTNKEIFNNTINEFIIILKKDPIKFENKENFFKKDIRITINNKDYKFDNIDYLSKNNERIKTLKFNNKNLTFNNDIAFLNTNVKMIIITNNGLFRLNAKVKSIWIKDKNKKRFIIKDLNIEFS